LKATLENWLKLIAGNGCSSVRFVRPFGYSSQNTLRPEFKPLLTQSSDAVTNNPRLIRLTLNDWPKLKSNI
jgi:hypothetical protein